MESQSDDFEVNEVAVSMPAFFDGLINAPRLTQKQKLLRNEIKLNSEMQTKQTTLGQKIDNRINHRSQSRNKSIDHSGQFQQKVIIQSTQRKANPNSTPKKDKSFEQLRIIKPLLKSIHDVNYIRPTPIQQIAIPVIFSGKDVVASSITGSGKTVAFLVPILQRYYNVAAVGYIRALIVTPTRELAIQIYQEFQKLNKYTKLEAVLVIGASSIQRQEQSLRNHPQVVIGTPGRIIDVLLNSRSIGIENLEMIVFDQADKLLELGFEAEIKEIMSHARDEVQTIMFSATMGKDVNQLVKITTKKPIRLSADPDNKTAQKLHQQVLKLRQNTQEYRQAVLLSVITNLYKQKVIIFFKTKKQCHRIAIIMGLLGFKACELHGNLSQTQRIQAFMDFKEGKQQFLLATDLAARGLDIKMVKTVINYELPTQLTKYIHRIGRTARAGSIGTSLTLCSDLECLELKKMSRKTGDKLFKLTPTDSSVKHYMNTIHDLEREIAAIYSEEREEMEIRKAEMEIKKIENIQDHKEEIYGRPKKEWFLSEKEKKSIQQQAKIEAGIAVVEKQDKRRPNFHNKRKMIKKSGTRDANGKKMRHNKKK